MMTMPFRFLLTASAFVCPLVGFAATPAFSPHSRPMHIQRATPSGESVVIQKRTRVYKRKTDNKFIAEKGPIKVEYPVVSGLRNASILRRVQKALLPTSVYDAENGDIAADGWLDNMTYTVNCNRHSVLDVTFSMEGMAAYPDDFEKQVTLDLRTGKPLRAADLFRPEAQSTLAAQIDRQMQADMRQAIRDVEKEIDPNETDKAASKSVREQLQGKRFGVKKLNAFSINARGVTFRYEFGFPHVMKAAEPKGRYFFSFADLRPYIRRDGLLAAFVR